MDIFQIKVGSTKVFAHFESRKALVAQELRRQQHQHQKW